MKKSILYLLALFLLSCSGNEPDITNTTPTKPTLKETYTDFSAVYHFGESEMESDLIILKVDDNYYAQLKSGSFNADATDWIWNYENFTNIRVEGNMFYSDQTNGEFVIGNDGSKGLKIENSWSGLTEEDGSETGFWSYSVNNYYTGDYTEASLNLLTKADVENKTKEELEIMRNEIFARYGYIFKSGGKMDNYFKVHSWYHRQHKNVNKFLTGLEQTNVAFIKKMEPNAIDENQEISSTEYSNSLIGLWTCNANKSFELKNNGIFQAYGFNNEASGNWWLTNNTVFIAIEDDTVSFEIETMNMKKMVIKNIKFKKWHEFFCQTGFDYTIYSTLYKDRPIRGSFKHALIGYWYSNEGFELNPDGTFDYHGPDCEGGTWESKNGNLVMNYNDCYGTVEYKDFKLTTNRLILDESDWLFRQHDDESYIKTQKSTTN